jgi:predicted ATPase
MDSRGRPFIGRERELEELRTALDDAVAGRGRLVLLVGEPGIGKSRTAEEVAALAQERAAEVLLGRCYEDEGAPALWPWVQIIRGYVGARADADLGAALGAEAAEIAQMVPEIRARFPGLPSPPARDADSARFRLFDGMATFLGRAARARPIVLVLDDLQGADQPSLLLLRFLARGLRDVPLLVVGTFREVALTRGDPLAETLGELLREPVTTRLSLRGFSEAEVARFVEAAGLAAPPALVARIHERTEGNPFFMGEIVRWLAETGQLEGPDRGLDVAIPAGVRAAVARRLGRLSDSCAAMLRMASGFGREFRTDAVAQASGLEHEPLAALLTEALAAHLIGDVPDRPGRYRFAHALTRDALYEEVPAPHRAELHLRLAAGLERVTAPEVDPPLAELGAQFLAANDPRGIDYARRAGDRALELLAYEEAVRQYGTALAALDRTAPADEELRCDLLIALASAQNQAGETVAGKKTALRAAESARRRGATDQLRRAAVAFAPGSCGATRATRTRRRWHCSKRRSMVATTRNPLCT